MRYIIFIILLHSIQLFSKSWDEYHINKYDNLLTDLHSNGEINGAVLVGSSMSVHYKKVYGYKDVKKSALLNYDTSFRLASVSKIFTGLSVMILNEKYGLNYNEYVQSYITEFPYNQVTVRHLLTHTSGLSDYTEIYNPYEKDVGRVLTNRDVIDSLIESNEPLSFEPGDRYEYNNTNYVLLSELVFRVSGLTYEDFLMSYVFKPLSMSNTRVFNLISPNRKFSNRAKGYEGGKEVTFSWLDGVSGDGAVFSSINDLYLFYKGLRDYKIVSRETFKEGITPYTLNNGEKSLYGFGWAILEDGSLQHGGGWLGARTFFQCNLDRDEVIIALDSSASDKLWDIVAYEGVKLSRYISF